MSSQDFLVVLITAPDERVAEQLSEVLVKEKAAACVNIVPHVKSVFSWQGSLSSEDEVLMVVKTRETYFKERIIPLIRGHHPYEVPEIIALPIVHGSEDYLKWIEEEME